MLGKTRAVRLESVHRSRPGRDMRRDRSRLRGWARHDPVLDSKLRSLRDTQDASMPIQCIEAITTFVQLP